MKQDNYIGRGTWQCPECNNLIDIDIDFCPECDWKPRKPKLSSYEMETPLGHQIEDRGEIGE